MKYDLAITASQGALGKLLDTLDSKLANWGRDNNCKFYYDEGAGNLEHYVARKVAQGAVSELTDLLDNEFNSWIGDKKKNSTHGDTWVKSELKKVQAEKDKYGTFNVKSTDGKDAVVYALDDWGGIATEALMLAIETELPIKISQTFPEYKVDEQKLNEMSTVSVNSKLNSVETNTLVWYDTTALITVNSDKNLISTKVQGRDYSRKELVSNGDIKLSVSGQITSGKPDIYPDEEVQKFIKVMQYKGIVKINNQVLDQFGISHIVIENFSITPKEGYKALQQYTFSAIGLQPESEIVIKEDTVEILAPEKVDPEESNGWVNMFKNQGKSLWDRAEALGTGALDSVL